MNYKNVLKILSLINITVSVIFLLDALVDFVYKERYEKFLLYDVLFFLVNFLVWLWLRKH